MRLNVFRRMAAALPFAIGLVAVTGIVHITSILAYPGKATADAFGRVAALAPLGVKTDLPSARSGLPGQDAAMAAAVCRYDLGQGPFRIVITPFDDGFLSFGMHSRSGVAFYGLNLHASDDEGLTLVLVTAEQKAAAEQAAGADEESQDLLVAAPEQQGFVVAEAPAEAAGGARALLDHVSCGGAAAAPAAPAP
jgi:uncharacterized membrane protein